MSDIPGASDLLNRNFLASLAGLQFGGKRDLYDVFGYKKILTYDDMYSMYARGGVSKRVVDEPVKGIWANPPDMVADDAFVGAWKALVKSQKLWTTLARADTLCAFGEFSILLLGLPGSSEQPAVIGPRRRGAAQTQLLYLQPYSTKEATIKEYDTNTASPRFGLPSLYEVRLGDGTGGVKQTIKVHYSRIVHITDNLLVDNSRSMPRLSAVYNYLDDLLKVSGGSAETYWLNASRGMQVDIDKDMDLNAGDAKDLAAELEEFQHQLRRYIRTRGVKVTPLGSNLADPKGTFEVLISLIAGVTGIPQRILMGAEAGQLASEQDRANWAVQVEDRRNLFAVPYVLQPLITRLVELGVLPDPGESLEYEWPEAFKMSPLERAQMMAQKARAIVNMSRQAIEGHPLVTVEEARNIIELEDVPPELPTVEVAVEFARESKVQPQPDEQPGTAPNSGDDLPDGSPSDPAKGKGEQEEPINGGLGFVPLRMFKVKPRKRVEG